MSVPPKVLWLSQRFLLPMDTGGKIRTGKLLEQLKELWSITVVGNYEERTDARYLDQISTLADRFVPVPWVETRRSSPLWYLRTLVRGFSRYPVNVLNDTSEALASTVRRELAADRYDLLVCDFLQSTLNVPDDCSCPRLLFTHNVETRIARRHYQAARNPLLKAFWWRQQRVLHRYEGRVASRYDRVIAVSDSDRDEFEKAWGLRNVRTIPTGVDTEANRPSDDPIEPNSIVFCGSMDWLPNQDGVAWFVKEVFPLILAKVPEAKLVVIGRSPPPRIVSALSCGGRVEFTGWVEDVRPSIARGACYVVPLRIGGGTRIKIYEAMAMEKPIVSTSVGAEGLAIEPDVHYHREDRRVAFSRRVVECLQDPATSRAMGRRARAHVEANFGWDRVASVFAAIGEEAMTNRRRLLIDDQRLHEQRTCDE